MLANDEFIERICVRPAQLRTERDQELGGRQQFILHRFRQGLELRVELIDEGDFPLFVHIAPKLYLSSGTLTDARMFCQEFHPRPFDKTRESGALDLVSLNEALDMPGYRIRRHE